MKTIIDSSFNPDRRITIAETQAALQAYSDGFPAADNLEDLPIFIDANALLKFYKISFHEREQITKFLTANKERIYITPQIESEFLKHRIEHINTFQNSLSDTLKRFSSVMKDIHLLKDGQVNTFSQFNKDNKIIIEDNAVLHEELEGLYHELSEKLKSVFIDDYIERVSKKADEIESVIVELRGSADIERRDEFLALISEFKIVGQLTPEEKDFIKTTFSKKKEDYDQTKSDQAAKYNKSFPGCGEKKEGDQSGDYLIYHEILKFIKTESQTNVIFLTDDITKDDWLTRKGDSLLPYTHYIVNDFICTGKIIYIFPATDKLRISYDAIYAETSTREASNEVKVADNIREETTIINQINESESDTTSVFMDTSERLQNISENRFISELKTSENWANSYGAGFVGKDYFIKKILKNKGFNIESSEEVLQNLTEKGSVIIYDHDEGYRPLAAIRLYY